MSLFRKLMRAAFPDSACEVDLHGMKVPQALETVEKVLAEIAARGGGRVRIICGKGKGSPGGVGVLGPAVTGWLDAHGYRGSYVRNVERDGLDGSVTVEVRP